MIKSKDDWTTVYGGPGSQLNDYSFTFQNPRPFNRRPKIRKDKIKKIFDADRKES